MLLIRENALNNVGYPCKFILQYLNNIQIYSVGRGIRDSGVVGEGGGVCLPQYWKFYFFNIKLQLFGFTEQKKYRNRGLPPSSKQKYWPRLYVKGIHVPIYNRERFLLKNFFRAQPYIYIDRIVKLLNNAGENLKFIRDILTFKYM